MSKNLIGLAAFVTCLWVAVVATYAAQLKNDNLDGKKLLPLDDCECTCSSSSSSSGEP